MEAAVELAFKRPHRHVCQPGQLLIRYGCMVVIPQVKENRAELNPREAALAGAAQSPGDAGCRDDGANAIAKRDFVSDVPGERLIRLANQLNAVDDAIAGQHILVIQAILIGEKGGGPVIIRLAENAVGFMSLVTHMTVCRIHQENGTIYPGVSALTIFDPGAHILDKVEELGKLQPKRMLCHGCHFVARSRFSHNTWVTD